MAVKVAPRASISDDFKTAMTTIYTAKLQKYQAEERALTRDPSRHHDYMQTNGASISLMRALIKDPTRIDMEYTRLRSLPYTKFELVVREGYPYLYGLTKDVILDVVTPAVMEMRSRRSRSQKPLAVIVPEFTTQWDMGAYGVVIPMAFFGPTRLKYPDRKSPRTFNAVQMIPMREMLSHNRTPHHYADMQYVGGEPVSNNPLDMKPQICWGGFSSIVLACGDDCDIVEAFRNIYIYLGRYNPNSPYVSGITDDLSRTFHFAKKVA